MNDPMEVLFAYAQDWVVKPLLLAEPEYESLLHDADRQEQRLRSMLNDETKQLLDTLMDERDTLSSLYRQALFRAGFQTAVELSR